MNQERQPLSGKLVEALQKKYIQRRITLGTAKEDSWSESILHHLKTKGIIGGMPAAFNESRKSIGFGSSIVILPIAATEFLLTVAGIELFGTGKDGDWNPIDEFETLFPPRRKART